MGYLSIKEYVIYCGLDSYITNKSDPAEWKKQTDKVHVWVKRKKIDAKVINGEKVIDTANVKNSEWAKKIKTDTLIKSERGVITDEELEESENEISFNRETINVSLENEAKPHPFSLKIEDEDVSSDFNVEKKIKKQTLLKLRAETSLKNIQISKIEAKIIPTEVAQIVLGTHNRTFVFAMRDQMEIFIKETVSFYELSTNEEAKLREKVYKYINNASLQAITLSEKALENEINNITDV